jgi:hypothetical protein
VLSLYFVVLPFAVRSGIMEHCTALSDASFSPVSYTPLPFFLPLFTGVTLLWSSDVAPSGDLGLVF